MKYLSSIAATVLILVAVLLPGSSIPDVGFSSIDKVAHFCMFLTWSVALRHDFDQAFRWPWVLVAGLMFSLQTEVLQLLVEGRSFDLNDLAADSAGLLIGIANGKFFLRIWNWLAAFLPSNRVQSGKKGH